MIAEPRSFRVSEGATRRPVTGRGEQAEGREPWLPHIFMHAPCQMPKTAQSGGMFRIPACNRPRRDHAPAQFCHFSDAEGRRCRRRSFYSRQKRGFDLETPPIARMAAIKANADALGIRATCSRFAQKREGTAFRSTRKGSGHKTDALPSFQWSERPDSNRRPLDPQSSALPGCATLRHGCDYSDARAVRNPGRTEGSGAAAMRDDKPDANAHALVTAANPRPPRLRRVRSYRGSAPPGLRP